MASIGMRCDKSGEQWELRILASPAGDGKCLWHLGAR